MNYWLIRAPQEFATWFEEVPPDVKFVVRQPKGVQAAHLFCQKRDELQSRLCELRSLLDQDGFVWVSWPKKSSKISSEVTEDTIRELALPLGFVDIKVCAVSEVWSGLKLVIRKNQRKA